MKQKFKVLSYVPDEELEGKLNDAASSGYVIDTMYRNKPFGGGVENTTVIMVREINEEA